MSWTSLRSTSHVSQAVTLGSASRTASTLKVTLIDSVPTLLMTGFLWGRPWHTNNVGTPPESYDFWQTEAFFACLGLCSFMHAGPLFLNLKEPFIKCTEYIPVKNSPLSTFFVLLHLDFKKLKVHISYEMNIAFLQCGSNSHAGCTMFLVKIALFSWCHTHTCIPL